MKQTLWPNGTVVRHKPTKQKVTYVCYSGVEDIHIVIAKPLGFEDDGLREVKGCTLAPIVESPAFALWKRYWGAIDDVHVDIDRSVNRKPREPAPGGGG